MMRQWVIYLDKPISMRIDGVPYIHDVHPSFILRHIPSMSSDNILDNIYEEKNKYTEKNGVEPTHITMSFYLYENMCALLSFDKQEILMPEEVLGMKIITKEAMGMSVSGDPKDDFLRYKTEQLINKEK